MSKLCFVHWKMSGRSGGVSAFTRITKEKSAALYVSEENERGKRQKMGEIDRKWRKPAGFGIFGRCSGNNTQKSRFSGQIFARKVRVEK